MDAFGLDRELEIAKSNVRNIFTPHQPIQSVELFFGRRSEVQRIIEHLNTPGQHALLFGERGVGKSSLANVASELLLKHLVGGKLIKKRCDADDTFLSVVTPALEAAGVEVDVTGTTHTKTEGGNAGLSIPVLKAGIETETENSTSRLGFRHENASPSWVVSKIAGLRCLFLIDEVDAIRNPDDKRRLAELIKLLSDEAASLKVMLVGIAETAAELTAGHPSVQRCLRETRLGRMNRFELREILTKGQESLKLRFSEQAMSRIVTVSSGYPHFTHLLALKAAEDAIAEQRTEINVIHVENATRRAVEDAEGTLKRTYDEAVRSFGTDAYKRILLSAAVCREEEIVARDLRDSYERLWNESITQGSLNNYLQRLVSDDGSTILRRIAKGVYRFSDPRMPSYVRIAQAYLKGDDEQNHSDRDGL